MNTSKDIKKIEVIPYNAAWPTIFNTEAKLLKEALGSNCIEVHHIGSTSVPGLAAKEDIDILAVVDQLPLALAIQEKGYVFKGELNVPMRYFFSKSTAYPKVNLHVVEVGNGFAGLNLAFRDYLRTNKDACLAYMSLKRQLLSDPKSYERISGRFTGYNLGKDKFIKTIVQKAGFNGYLFNFCMHDAEWNAYHRIIYEQVFAPINLSYDRNHPSITAERDYHFVLYKGTKIVSAAHIEFLNENEAALRGIATDEPYKNQGHASYMLKLIEKWIKRHGRKVIKLHAALDAEIFYRKLGYSEMEFNDVSISDEIIDLGKSL